MQLGRLDEAIPQFQKALEIRPDFAEGYYNFANALVQQGKLAEAMADYRKAIELDPHYPEAHNNLGTALLQSGNPTEAVAHYRSAVELKPDYTEARRNLASTLYQQGQTREALGQWREAIRLGPNAVGFLNVTAWVLATDPDPAIRNGAEAVTLASRAAELTRRQDPAALDTLAAAYAEAGRFADAVATAGQARQLASDQGNRPLAETLGTRLKLYQAGTALRQTR